MLLKHYQSQTLKILSDFLSDCRIYGCEKSFEKNQNAFGYNPDYQPLRKLEDVPYICLRLPTGAGKTLIGTYAIQLAADNFLEKELPFVLWLVPSNEIRKQTLKILNDPNSFYNRHLCKQFKSRVHIFDVADFRRLKPQDLTHSLNICVATFQSFKVEDREGRKVYQADEELCPCFIKIPRQEYFTVDEKNRYESFANLISYLRPLMIVDEAHNYSTDLSFDVTKTLRPSAVIELTATPAKNSNVLVKVTAEELHREEMIKLPIILGEVSDSPEKTLDFAIQKRNALEKIAVTESEYIRPIALYQAESKNREFNVEFVKKYLIEVAKIPENEIAVATGDKHELDGINLFARDCSIRHIITVQALKEGWDCPFASIFCSLANTHSAKDAEQLLGRILRMPYAKRRKSQELNQAYAFFRVSSWTDAISKIKDDLFGMGFDDREVNFSVKVQTQLFTESTTIEIQTLEPPKIDSLSTFLQNQITSEKIDNGYNITFKDVSSADIQEIIENKNRIFTKTNDRNEFLKAVNQQTSIQTSEKSPADRHVKFSIPRLCLDYGDGPEVAKRENFFPAEGWSLTDTNDYSLALSHVESDVKFYEITLRGNKLIEQLLSNDEQTSLSLETNLTESELIYLLTTKIHDDSITREDLAEYIRRALNQLINEKNFSLAELFRMKFSLKKLFEEKIEYLKENACKQNWQMVLFNDNDPKVRVDRKIEFSFDSAIYPAKKFYQGSVQFQKHFYSVIGDMNSEEVRCAQYIDSNPKVETWIRNIERESENSFWLPTHKDRFYPDFVLKLTDGTFAVVEYKGENLATNDDTKEKDMLGRIWADKSNHLCKFLLATKQDTLGRDLSKQISEFLS